jgi:uncharacterized protein YjbI with pentapeptide repeats
MESSLTLHSDGVWYVFDAAAQRQVPVTVCCACDYAKPQTDRKVHDGIQNFTSEREIGEAQPIFLCGRCTSSSGPTRRRRAFEKQIRYSAIQRVGCLKGRFAKWALSVVAEGQAKLPIDVYFPDGCHLTVAALPSDLISTFQLRLAKQAREKNGCQFLCLFVQGREEPLRSDEIISPFLSTPIFAIPRTAGALRDLFGSQFPGRLAWATFCTEMFAMETLDFSGMDFTHACLDEALASLGVFTRLQVLILADLKGTRSGWGGSVASHVAGWVLDCFECNCPFADCDCVALAHLSDLRHLDISGNTIRADSANDLAEALASANLKFSQLKELRFSGYSPFMASQPVVMSTTLAEANFSNCGLGPSGAIILFAFLPRCAGLVYLDISDNQLRAGGATEAARFLRSNPSHLVHLNVSANALDLMYDGSIARGMTRLVQDAAAGCPNLEIKIDS